MKWLKTVITEQNLFIKLAIFITGIATGFECSLRQLIAQIALFLMFMLLEPGLYSHVLSALRRILPFLTGYWLFATIFAQSFPTSLKFSVQIIYLILVTVAVFGGVQMSSLASDSHYIRRNPWINALFFFSFSTWLYVKSFFHHYQQRQTNHGSEPIAKLVEEVFAAVTAETEDIRCQLREILAFRKESPSILNAPNITGIIFLALLVVLNNL
ncbi:MAG: hypothetical protein M0P99_05995 [Candidatus Cloacimonetes bacterium]|nr:hypothetical protein [Candidatus Cloacimonadota bacterium]